MSREPRAPSDVTVALCGPAERAEQARLFNACFKKTLDRRALAWRYDLNPHGAAVSVVSRPPGGEAVSGYACSPRRALAQGDERTLALVGETGDVMTHPDWRKRGLFSALDRACMQRTKELGWPLVFGLPNRRSAHIFLELGWRSIGRVRPWTHLLRCDAATRAVRAQDGRVQGWLASFGARKGSAARERLAREGAGMAVEELARFPAEVAELSRRVEARFAFMVRRDAQYLDWRFLASPSGLHRALGLRDERGSFAGYVVVQLPRAGETLGYLVDVLAPDERTLSAALAAGLARLERSGAGAVRATAIDGSWWSGVLRRSGFLVPKADNHLSVIVWENDPAHPLCRAATDASRWYLTDGDRDDETMG